MGYSEHGSQGFYSLLRLQMHKKWEERYSLLFFENREKVPWFCKKVPWIWKKSALFVCIYGLNSHLKRSFKSILDIKHQFLSLYAWSLSHKSSTIFPKLIRLLSAFWISFWILQDDKNKLYKDFRRSNTNA